MKIDPNINATRAALVTIVNDIDAYGLEPTIEALLERLADPECDIGLAKAARCAARCQKYGLKPDHWIEFFDDLVTLAASVTREQLKEGLAELARPKSH